MENIKDLYEYLKTKDEYLEELGKVNNEVTSILSIAKEKRTLEECDKLSSLICRGSEIMLLLAFMRRVSVDEKK